MLPEESTTQRHTTTFTKRVPYIDTDDYVTRSVHYVDEKFSYLYEVYSFAGV